MRKSDLRHWLIAASLGLCAGIPAAADPTLAGGLYHSLAVDSAGRVLSWGEDGSGQLGSGRATFVSTPTLIKDMPTGTVTALAAGVFHSLALMDDGRVLAWGDNAEGVLGDGSTQSHSSPLPVLGLPSMQRIHSGERHAVGTDTQGRLWSWGLNHMGQLGHSSSAYQSNVPLQVSLAGVLDARGGAAHTVALTSTGEVWAWGDNRMGQLGTSTPSQSGTPVRVIFPAGIPRITAIDAAGDQSYAIDNNGGLWAWGDNRYRQLAEGTVIQRSSPARISALTGVTAVSAGRVGAAAITSDGAVWTWGGYEAIATPAKLSGLTTTASAVRVGEYHLLVTTTNGSLLITGGNFNGQLGDGSTTTPSSGVLKTPLGVTGPVRQIGTGNKHVLAVDSTGRLWSWGDDLKGQTGSATETTRNIPVVVANLGASSQVAAGDSHSLALLRDGTVFAWGDNFGGAVGSGMNGVRTTPEAVVGLTGIRQISAAKASSAAIDAAGALWIWGDNSRGQLARPLSEGSIDRPVKAQDVPTLSQVALGGGHTVGLDGGGKLWAWGDNREGQLGAGARALSGPTPQAVTAVTDVRAIAAGEAHSLALDGQGRVWAWGRNTFAQVSPATDVSVASPVQVSGLPRIVAIAAGLGSSLALDVNGRIWGWGLNQFGELGQGTTGFTLQPTLTDGDQYVRLSAAPWHTLATRTDGVAWAFGWNDYGQLGEGSFVRQTLAAGIVNPTLDAFLDLVADGNNLPIPTGKVLPFFSQTRKVGSNRRLVLSTGIQIPPAVATRGLNQTAAASYNVYVVALVRAGGNTSTGPLGVFLKTRVASWQQYVGGPLGEYLRGVSENGTNAILVDILANDDISQLVGTQFLIGYGLDDNEMLSAGRYRLVYEVGAGQ